MRFFILLALQTRVRFRVVCKFFRYFTHSLELKIVTALSMIQPEIFSVSIMFQSFYMKNAINSLLFHHIQVSARRMETTQLML